jgi:hypothetical protein
MNIQSYDVVCVRGGTTATAYVEGGSSLSKNLKIFPKLYVFNLRTN